MSTSTLSPVRLGEIFAHFAFYEAEPHEAILAALGYPASALEDVASARARLHWALDGGLARGGVDDVRAFATAYDVVFRRLRARRPKLVSAAVDPRLEPGPAGKTPKYGGWVGLSAPVTDAAGPAPATVVPSYLQAAEPRDIGAPVAPAAPVAHASPEADETGMVDGRQILAGLKLPFVDAKEAAPFVPKTSTERADDEHGETLMAPMSPELRSALPFGASAAADLGRYVELTLALASGEDRFVVLERYGLDEPARERLSAEWADRFAKEPQLREAFNRLVRERRR